jgi:hypothetical protein
MTDELDDHPNNRMVRAIIESAIEQLVGMGMPRAVAPSILATEGIQRIENAAGLHEILEFAQALYEEAIGREGETVQ